MRFYFIMTLLIFITDLCFSQSTGGLPGDLEKLVHNEASVIFSVAGTSCNVTFFDGKSNMSINGKGIFLSKDNLKKYQKAYDPEMFRYIIDYLLSHELVHQIQFTAYKDEILKTTSCEKKSLYECQADILAGLYLSKLYRYNDTVSFSQHGERLASRALTFLYDIGDDEYTISTHPSHVERRNSIRIGTCYGMIGGNWSKGFNASLIKQIDFNPKESILDWSIKIAKRVNHYPLSAGKYINIVSLYNDSTATVWDTTKSNPIVKYSKSFENRGAKPIKVFVQFRLVGKVRINPYDKRLTDSQGDFSDFSFVLQPNEVHKCAGVLNWAGVGNKIYEPSLISAPDLEALYNAEFVDAQGVEELDNNCLDDMFRSNSVANLSMEKIDAALERINAASVSNFDVFKSGFSHETFTGTYYYDSNYRFPYSTNMLISETKTAIRNRPVTVTWRMSITLNNDSNVVAAKKIFNKLAIAINKYNNIKIDTTGFSTIGTDNTPKNIYALLPNNVISRLDKNEYTTHTMSLNGEFINTETKIDLEYTYDERYGTFRVELITKTPPIKQ